jgi:hypothetical protein
MICVRFVVSSRIVVLWSTVVIIAIWRHGTAAEVVAICGIAAVPGRRVAARTERAHHDRREEVDAEHGKPLR